MTLRLIVSVMFVATLAMAGCTLTQQQPAPPSPPAVTQADIQRVENAATRAADAAKQAEQAAKRAEVAAEKAEVIFHKSLQK